MKPTWKLSASLISSFKSCAWYIYLKYVLGLVPIEDTDSQRQGTNWHKCLEIMKLQPDPGLTNMDMVINYLNKMYETVPISKTKDDWLVERAVLLYSLCGYNWLYAEDDYTVVAEELEFSLPIRNPVTNRALPNVTLDGKIDKIVRSPNGVYYIDEHKSTSKSLDNDSTFWNHLNLDTQTTLYPYVAQQLQLAGQLEQFGIRATDPLISGVRYDAWHKPGIQPKKLTQAESKAFVNVDSETRGQYYGEQFEIHTELTDGPNCGYLLINGEPPQIEPGAKEGTFTIRETPEMFGARLLQDISERPGFYFARREITRTADDLKRFERQLYNIYKVLKFLEKNEGFWMNEQHCEATFRCPYIGLCYNNVDVASGVVPEGFRNIFVEKENDKT